jgi:hypothetical protein
MATLTERWLRPMRPRTQFPPYDYGDPEIVGLAQARTDTVARIYHKGHEQAWDGRAVLDELIAKHGGIRFPADKRDAFAAVASVLLWGELAAWSISADLAVKLEDTPAKMAASSQVFDEARHFHVLRDYLWQAGIEVPKLGGFSRKLLVDLLETENLLYKLVGMQLLVENTAVALFKTIGKANIEPVLSELFVYYERDEARHVGLGVLALPNILADMSRREAVGLWLFQTKIHLLMMGGGMTMREHFDALGVNQAELQKYGFRLQKQVFAEMRGTTERKANQSRTKGLFRLNRDGQERINNFLFPKQPEAELHPLHMPTLRSLVKLADAGDRWLRARSPV